MNLPNKFKSLGFTLVELMVVISIIGILETTGVVVFSSANINNRDAARQRDLNSLKQALELYFQTNNSYPGSGKYTSASGGSWIPSLIPTYFDTLPVDPLSNGTYFYTYQTSPVQINTAAVSCPSPAPVTNQYYILYTTLEGSINAPTTPLNGCGTGFPVTPTSKTYYILSQ